MKKKFFPPGKTALVFFAIPWCAVSFSCGIEAYNYLHYVSDITMEQVNTATIRLPDSNAEGYNAYFTNFTVFYRIYISDSNNDAKPETDTMLGNINNTLLSDYRAIKPSTDVNNTTVNTSIGTLFSNLKYYELELEGTDIKDILGAASLGQTAVIKFSTVSKEKPSLTIGGREYILYRSNNGGVFTPAPDRYFLSSDALCQSSNATTLINADVANKSNIPDSPRYTFAALYIAAVGKDYLTTFYSMPTFIGVFKLPED